MFGSITQISSILFGFLIVLGNHLARAEEKGDDYLFCNRDVCLPKNYSTDTLPNRPVKVAIQVYSIEVKRVMDEDMSLMVELGIRYCQLTNFLRSFYQLLTRCDVSLLRDLCLI